MATDEARSPGAISPATPEPTEPDAPTNTTDANKGGAKHWIARPDAEAEAHRAPNSLARRHRR